MRIPTNSEMDNTNLNPLQAIELVDEHGDYLYRYAMSRLHDQAAAEDVVQETFLSALQSGADFAARSSVRTWLTGILKHKVIDHFRRASRHVTFDFSVDDTSESTYFGGDGHWRADKSPSLWHETSESLLESREFMTVLEQCVAALPQNLSIVFTLREIEGLDSKEICRILNISYDNFCVIMHRARLRLRELLGHTWFSNEIRRDVPKRSSRKLRLAA